MIEEGFEIKKKLNNLCLEAASKRLCSETEWIYFDEKQPFDFSIKLIPLLENTAYILALFNHKTTESFLKGERLLNRLLSYNQNGLFPKYLHEFPDHLNPYTSFYLFPYFLKILENFRSYLKPQTLNSLESNLDQMKMAMQRPTIYKHLVVLNEAILGRHPQKIDLSKENALALGLLKGPIKLDVDTSLDVFFENGHIQKCLIDYIIADQKGIYTKDLLDDHPLHLLLSLFYEPFEKKQISLEYDPKKRLIEGVIFDDEKGLNQIISFDQKGFDHFEIFSSGFHIKGNLNLHESFNLYLPKEMKVTQFNHKGCFFLKNEPIVIQGFGKSFSLISNNPLELRYAKRQKELFDKTCYALGLNYSGHFDIRLKKIDG